MRGGPAFLPFVMLALTSGPALSAPAARVIACDPPLDRPMTLVMQQNFFLADGTPASATVARSLRFTRNTDGLAVEAHVAAIETDEAKPDALARLRLAYGAPGDVAIRIHLDPAMRVERIDSLDRLWQDFRHRQTLLAGAMGQDHRSATRAQAIGTMLDKMSMADRIAVLTAFLKPVVRYCGTVLPGDARLLADGTTETEIRADTGNASEVSRYQLDSRTGLMRRLDRKLLSADAPLRPLQEQWTLQITAQ